MSFESKYFEKLKHQRRVNPGNKEKYEPEFRGRSTVFISKKGYNRQKQKLEIKNYGRDEN